MKLGLRGKVVLAAGVAVGLAIAVTAALAGFALAEPVRREWWSRAAAIGLPVAATTLGLLAWVLQRWALRPLVQVVQAMERVQRSADNARPPAHAGDELAHLAAGFDRLAQAAAQRERELEAARDAAEEASRVKSQFMAVMSHELRTPLNAVLGMAELLHGTKLDARQQRFVTQIRSSGRALVDIVDDVLDLTRLQAGRFEPVEQPFRLRDAVFDTVELFRDSAEARALELSAQVDASLPDVVRGDVMHLRQILTNLLSNAVKFTERGSVIVRVAPSNDRVRFSISDTGIGIASDFMPHIYEAFRQADSSPTRRFGGAGLGLSIARRLCVAMGGLIDATSRPGKGSTFWFELPLPAATGAPVDGPFEAALAAPSQAGRAHADGAPVAVLLVEDQESDRQVVIHSLTDTRFALTLARDGTEAMRWVRRQHFDVVLLDWQLPGIDGLTVLAGLREAEAAQGRARAHVIALTAHNGPGDRETCLAAGADGYLAKPCSPAELLNQMDTALGMRPIPRGA